MDFAYQRINILLARGLLNKPLHLFIYMLKSEEGMKEAFAKVRKTRNL